MLALVVQKLRSFFDGSNAQLPERYGQAGPPVRTSPAGIWGSVTPVELAWAMITGATAVLASPLAQATMGAAKALATDIVGDRVKALINGGIDGARTRFTVALADKARQPANHDMLRAIRTAQLQAVQFLLASHLKTSGIRPTEAIYCKEGLVWVGRMLGAIAGTSLSVSDVNSALTSRTEPALSRTDPTTATWDELNKAVANPTDLFKTRFFDPERGWFEAFRVFLAEQVKTNERFRRMLVSTQISDIQTTNDRLEQALDDMLHGLDELTREIHRHLDEVQQDLAAVAAGVSELTRVATDPSPFAIIDQDSPIIFSNPAGHTLPTWDDYTNSRVPSLNDETSVRNNLTENGWVCVVGLPSVGKTTLAFRLTISDRQSAETIHYLDIGDIYNRDQAFVAMSILTRMPGYIILDNAHHEPTVTNRLLEAWRRSPRVAKLIILVTKMPSDPFAAPLNSLAELMVSAVEVSASQHDFGQVAAFLYRRAMGENLPTLPTEAMEQWRTTFGGQLHAFGFAVLESLTALKEGRWTDLTMASAVGWVKRKWVNRFTGEERANANRLAALGTQALELYLPRDTLPFPDTVEDAKSILGQITIRKEGRDRDRIRLAEPGWGELLLQAQKLDAAPLLADAGANYPPVAIEISRRLAKAGRFDQREAFWRALDQRREALAPRVPGTSPQYLRDFLEEGWAPERSELVGTVLSALEENAEVFSRHAWDPPVSHLGALLKWIAARERNVAPLWASLIAHTDDIHAALSQSPLGHVGGFLRDASELDLDTAACWDALQQDNFEFLDWVRREPLHDLASFMRAARQAGRDLPVVWGALGHVLPDKLKVASIQTLAGFVREAPHDLLKAAMLEWTPELWGDRLSKPLQGGVWVASACIEVDRPDLAKPVVEALMDRKSAAFPASVPNSLYCMVLTAVIARQLAIPDSRHFLRTVLPTHRLRREFARPGNTGILCNMLALAAERLPAADRTRFVADYTVDRLKQELDEFPSASDDQKVLTVRLMGAASLNGLAIPRALLDGVTSAAIEALPTRPPGQHRGATPVIERWQFQMWLGIRVYAQITGRHLFLSADIIRTTRDLWIETRNAYPDGPIAPVNESMISWFDAALREGLPTLRPGGERLHRLLSEAPC